jgi:hypothetical protein
MVGRAERRRFSAVDAARDVSRFEISAKIETRQKTGRTGKSCGGVEMTTGCILAEYTPLFDIIRECLD